MSGSASGHGPVSHTKEQGSCAHDSIDRYPACSERKPNGARHYERQSTHAKKARSFDRDFIDALGIWSAA